MTIESSVSNDFLSTFIDSINIFHCHLSSVFVISFRVCESICSFWQIPKKKV